MSVTPFEGKTNSVKEAVSLAMAYLTLRSINCPLVFAVPHHHCTNEDRDPLFFPVSFPE